MSKHRPAQEQIQDLQNRLREAEETIEAIRTGGVDALVVYGPEEERVYTLRSADQSYRTLIEQMQDGAVVLGGDGTVTYCNRHFAELLRRPLEQVLGEQLINFVAPSARAEFQNIIAAPEGRHELKLVASDRAEIPVQVAAATVKLEDVPHICLAVADLTQAYRVQEQIRKLTEEALRRRDTWLKLAQEAGHIGVFDVEVHTGAAHWTPEQEAIYGIRPGAFDGKYHSWAERVHPDDLPAVTQALQEAYEEQREEIQLDYRIVWPEGEVRWISDRSLITYDESGNAIRMIGSCIDVTERKMTEQALTDADKRKNEFLAMLAHELRNPLAPMRNAVQIMRMVGEENETIERQRDIIDRQITHMARLLDDLLDVSRITRGQIDVKMKPVSLAKVLAHAIETVNPIIEARRHTLNVMLPPEDVFVNGDADRLGQVFANILNNAAKYTDTEGQIWLAALKKNGNVVVRVRDNGAGIAPDVLPRIFDLFAQAEQTLARSQGGLGIGLTLVRSIIGLHGGRVEAKSAGLGQGTEFIVTLPAILAPEVSEPEQPERPELGPTAVRRRVLVVDDVSVTATSLAQILELWGHEVAVALDGPSALETARSFHPDFVLLDIGLPGMDGYQVARQLRKEFGQDIVLAAQTGYNQEADHKIAQEAGFNYHLVKPIDLQKLRDLLAESAKPTTP